MEEPGDRRRDKQPKALPSETAHSRPRLGHRPANTDICRGPIPPEPSSPLLRRPDPSALTASSSSQEAHFFAADTNATIQGGQCINHHGNVTNNYNFSSQGPPQLPAHVNLNNDVDSNNPLVDRQVNSAPGRGRRGSKQARRGRNATTQQQAAITKSHQRSNKIYESHLKRKDRGYPLWMPQPGMGFPFPYRIKGVSIGDVGIINPYGNFDFLFNICLPYDNPINPPMLPNGFAPIHPSLGPIDVSKVREFAPGSFLTASSVTMKYYDKRSPASGLNFECSDPEGAILTIPDGAYHEELVNVSRFKRYMAKHLENWYKFVNGPLGREAKNGDIRLVVGCDKTTTWGMAVFSNPPQTTSQLTFRLDEQHQMDSGSKHVWEHSAIAGEVRVGPGDDESNELEATPERPLRNQCLFVRTLNVLLADHIWAKLEAALLVAHEETSDSDYNTGSGYTSQSRDSGRGNSSSTSFDVTRDSQHGNPPADQLPAVGEDDPPLDSTHHSFIVTEFTPSPPTIHPSKILNEFLLLQKPNAIMAITHDRDWYSLLSQQDVAFPDSPMFVQRVQILNDICEDNGIVYLHPKRRDQKNIDDEQAQVAKVRLDLVSGGTTLLVYLFGHFHGDGDMQLKLSETIEDLDNHISSAPHPLEHRVPLTLPGNPDRLLTLDDLLRLLREEFVYEAVQEESISSLWNRLDSVLAMDPASQTGIQCLLRLGNVLQRRYSRLNLVDDLDNAIHCYGQAVSLCLPSNPHYQHLDANLGLASSIHQRYIAKGRLEDLIILKSTLEQREGFDVKAILQPLEDQLSESRGYGTIEETKLQEEELPLPHSPHAPLGNVDPEQGSDSTTGISLAPPLEFEDPDMDSPPNLPFPHTPPCFNSPPDTPFSGNLCLYSPFSQHSELSYTEDIDPNFPQDFTMPVNEYELSEYDAPEQTSSLVMFETDYMSPHFSPNNHSDHRLLFNPSSPSSNVSLNDDMNYGRHSRASSVSSNVDKGPLQLSSLTLQHLHPIMVDQQQPSGTQQLPPINQSLSPGRCHSQIGFLETGSETEQDPAVPLGGMGRMSPYISPNASPHAHSYDLDFDPSLGGTGLNRGDPTLPVARADAASGWTANASRRRQKQAANFACTVPGCEATFTSGYNLKGHLRSHYEKAPYVCPWPGCGKGFVRQDNCKRHEELHSNFGQYECEGCQKQFAGMDALTRHMKSDSGKECVVIVGRNREVGSGGGQGLGVPGPDGGDE